MPCLHPDSPMLALCHSHFVLLSRCLYTHAHIRTFLVSEPTVPPLPQSKLSIANYSVVIKLGRKKKYNIEAVLTQLPKLQAIFRSHLTDTPLMSSVANQMRFSVQNPIQDRTLRIRKPLACLPANLVYAAVNSKEETLPQIRPEMQLDPCSCPLTAMFLQVSTLSPSHTWMLTLIFFFLKERKCYNIATGRGGRTPGSKEGLLEYLPVQRGIKINPLTLLIVCMEGLIRKRSLFLACESWWFCLQSVCWVLNILVTYLPSPLRLYRVSDVHPIIVPVAILSSDSGHSSCIFFDRCGVGEGHAQMHLEAPQGPRGGHAEGLPHGRRLMETTQGKPATCTAEEPTGTGGLCPDSWLGGAGENQS